MRKIKVREWANKGGKGEEDRTESSVDVLKSLLLMPLPDGKMPRGLDKFVLYSRTHRAIENAKTSGFIELEEAEYEFLKKEINVNVPSVWASNKDIVAVINDFLEAKKDGG